MGTINYCTSDFITIGYNCNYIDYDNEFYHEIISDYFYQVKRTLEKYTFNCFNVTVEPGYYEGFSINIKFDFLYFDDYKEKQAAQKEITKIKEFLIQCINDFECCVVFPGWCTSYLKYNDSLKAIPAAIWEMREKVKSTKTWRNYYLKEAI